MIYRTRWGLRLRAAGEKPAAAGTVGINVLAIRYRAIFFAGLISGLAGSYLSLASGGSFQMQMTAGKGFIGLAAMIFGAWHPIGAFLAALVFGFADSVQSLLSILGVGVAPQILASVPYVVTIIVVAGVVGPRPWPGGGRPAVRAGLTVPSAMTDAIAAPTFFPAPAVPRTAPLGTAEKPLPLIIDSDPGLDDALAIGLAVARPEIDLLAVTTVGGNADVRHCTTNALRLLHLYGAARRAGRGGLRLGAVRRRRPGDRDPRRGAGSARRSCRNRRRGSARGRGRPDRRDPARASRSRSSSRRSGRSPTSPCCCGFTRSSRRGSRTSA